MLSILEYCKKRKITYRGSMGLSIATLAQAKKNKCTIQGIRLAKQEGLSRRVFGRGYGNIEKSGGDWSLVLVKPASTT